MPDRVRKPFTICVLLFTLALLVRLAFIGLTQFDGLYGQDAFAYFGYAHVLLQSTRALHMPAPFAWPLGFPALIALNFAMLGVAPVAAQLVSLVTGAMIAPLVYLLAREVLLGLPGHSDIDEPLDSIAAFLRADTGPIVAGLTAAVSGQVIQSSIVTMADAPAAFWSVLSALALLRYARTRAGRWWFFSASTLLLALLTRWLFGALLVPWSLVFLHVWWRAPGTISQRAHKALLHAVLPILCALPVMVVQWNALVPSTSLNHAWVTAWSAANVFKRNFDTPDGHFDYPLPVGIFYAQPLVHPFYLFPFLLPFWTAGVWALRRAPPTSRLILWGWPLAVYLFLLGIPYENFRFGLALWPPLAVLTGVGFDWLWGRLPVHRNWHAVMLGMAAISMLGMLAWTGRGLEPIVIGKNETLTVVRAVSAQLPGDATLIALGLGGFFTQYEPDVNYVELYNQSSTSLERYICARSPVFLLIEPGVIATQWAKREPELNVNYLREHAGLQELRKFGSLTLYQVGAYCA